MDTVRFINENRCYTTQGDISYGQFVAQLKAAKSIAGKGVALTSLIKQLAEIALQSKLEDWKKRPL